MHKLIADEQFAGRADARAERQPGVDGNSETTLGRRIVAPFGHEEEAAAHLHRLEQIACGLHPIALFLFAHKRSGIEREQPRPSRSVFEEGADARR